MMESDTVSPGVRKKVDLWSTTKLNYTSPSRNLSKQKLEDKFLQQRSGAKNSPRKPTIIHEAVGEINDSIDVKDADTLPASVTNLPLTGVVQKPIYLTNRSRNTTYASTKTVAQGFLNMSLLSANAGQLKQVLKHGVEGDFFWMLLLMILSSMVLQMVVSSLLALKYFIDFDDDGIDEEEKRQAEKYNSLATILVMIVTALNVIISVFIG